MSPGPILQVAVPAPLMALFDYLPPAGVVPALVPGQRVRVPFGRSTRIGLLVGLKATSDLPVSHLKAALAILDPAPLLPPDVLALLAWASTYYQHPPGEVFATAVPKALRTGSSPAQGPVHWQLTPAGRAADPATLRRAPAQRQLLTHLQEATALSGDELAATGAGWRRAIAALEARGWVTGEQDDAVLSIAATAPDTPPDLNAEQSAAVEAVAGATGFRGFLLDGVTGSGKTEVYLHCIQRVLAAGRQSLLLVPEIGLTPQLLERVRRRFAVPIAVLHSGLADGERLRAWTAAANGSAAIVIGTRSAVFTPLPRPGLVIVDEEHDTSYKQQDGFRYSARDLAVYRARQLGIPVILGSATPALESLENARVGRYQRLALSSRAGDALPPSVYLVDLRRQPAPEGLTPTLTAAIHRHLAAGGQVLIYLNRRGFAPTLVCPECSRVVGCPRCDARLVLHQQKDRVICHHCGHDQPAPHVCADCSQPLFAVGQGTERLEQALAREFPDEQIERLDRDTTRRRGEIEQRLERFRRAEARLLLGTQMLTKGHDFPRVTLVGVVDADQGLFGTDFRSAERLAQVFTQVAGRAGRADRPGEVYLQTLFPAHPLLQVLLSKGYGAFAELALEERRRAGWPPSTSIALLRAEATVRKPVFDFLGSALQSGRLAGAGRIRLLGPAPAPMERRAGRYRGQLLVQADTRQVLQSFLPGWRAGLAALDARRQVRWSLDVDPVELF